MVPSKHMGDDAETMSVFYTASYFSMEMTTICFQAPLFKGEVAEHETHRDQTTQVGTHVQRR